MNNSMHQAFQSLSGLLEYSKKVAEGAESFSTIDVEEIQVGMSPKEQIAQIDKVTLHHYKPIDGIESTTDPVLIVYGLIGRYTMIDLQEDRSLVKNLLARGVDLYVVDWGYPTRADQFLNFDDYVNDYLDECVNTICNQRGIDSLNVFGICEGGVFSTMYAARYPEKVSNLVVSITPIDFAADREDDDPGRGFINLWTRNLSSQDIERMIDVNGNLSGEVMGAVFQALTPVRSMTKYSLGLADMAADNNKLLNFLRMEKWLADRPHHPGAAAKQWLINLYQENQLVNGEFVLGGEKVDLSKINMPVLNVFAEKDHIIPPPYSKALGKHVGSEDYTELPLNGGHVGIYVSSKLQNLVSGSIFEWLSARQSTAKSVR